MPVKYITVTAQTNLFLPATRSFGDIAILGAIDADAKGAKEVPVAINNPSAVSGRAQTLVLSADAKRRVAFAQLNSSSSSSGSISSATSSRQKASNSSLAKTSVTRCARVKSASGRVSAIRLTCLAKQR